MNLNPYQCPLCGRTLARDLMLYLDHTQGHVIEQIKKEHPEWVAENGICQPCAEYYRRQLSGEIGTANLGPRGRRKRYILGIIMTAVSLGLAFFIKSAGLPQAWRLLLFFPLFGAFLGFIQAREKTCAVLAEKGVRDMDGGEGKISDTQVACRLRTRGRLILVKSALFSALLTALFYLFL